MKVLGIETSCDETAAAVVEDGVRIISNVVVSQIDIHKAFGGVVPEVAARSHIEAILPVVDQAVAPVGWDEIDAIAVTTHPGLIGSLMIGTLTARTLALVKNKPLYPVDHVEAHVYANFLDSTASPSKLSETASRTGSSLWRLAGVQLGAADVSESSEDFAISFPVMALIVSGGHTEIALFRDHGDYEIIGQTRDDAAGEAFDKVAKILGLPYPGGPAIAAAATLGDPQKYKLPKAKMDNPLDFSFSGLKTAVLRAVQAECGKSYDFPSNGLHELLNDRQRHDFAASFQKTAVETLVDNVEKAYTKYQPKSVVIAGGVAANSELRRQLSARLPVEIHCPAPELCTDNAAMVASLGYFMAQKDAPTDPLNVHIAPN
jgi:N6-L-threonylcarbamoyladenine synthase